MKTCGLVKSLLRMSLTVQTVFTFPIFSPNFTALANDVTDANLSSIPNPYLHHHTLSKRSSPTLQNFLPDHCAEAARVETAFANELMLASRAYLADYTSSSFLRYFQAAHAERVRTVFSRWFFPSDAATDPEGLRGNVRFSLSRTYYGDAATLVDDNDDCADNDELEGYSRQDREDLWGRTGNGLFICSTGFARLPDMDDIPCNMLDPVVSGRMNCLAALTLHEHMHWNYLVTGGIAGGTTYIPDWDDPPAEHEQNPPHAYGPFNAMRINQLSVLPQLPQNALQPDPLRNAENYVWFALEGYFKWKCGVEAFGDPVPLPGDIPAPDPGAEPAPAHPGGDVVGGVAVAAAAKGM